MYRLLVVSDIIATDMGIDLTEADVRRILGDLYNVEPKSVKEILGFYCKNFIISVDEKATASEVTGTYIMKILGKEQEMLCGKIAVVSLSKPVAGLAAQLFT